MSGASSQFRPLVLGNRTGNESETAETVFSKKRSSIDSEIKVPLFVAIPREIRDMIVGNLLRAGDLGILRVSKALSEEALERINQEATCRIYYGCSDHANSHFSKPANPAGIHNVEFHFHISNLLIVNPPNVTQFREDCATFCLDECNTAPKSTCNITLTYETLGLETPRGEMFNLFFQALRPLAGFENVVLEVVPIRTAGLYFGLGLLPEKPPITEKRLLPTLERLLGAVTMVGEGEGRLMVFHPDSSASHILAESLHLRQADG